MGLSPETFEAVRDDSRGTLTMALQAGQRTCFPASSSLSLRCLPQLHATIGIPLTPALFCDVLASD
jgi:hypothetical protein